MPNSIKTISTFTFCLLMKDKTSSVWYCSQIRAVSDVVRLNPMYLTELAVEVNHFTKPNASLGLMGIESSAFEKHLLWKKSIMMPRQTILNKAKLQLLKRG